ncbi:hypothetical protein PsorP6_010211 [Peronosclerospora sorghi]|uniref:Uncharacterized protein n=1 Tax=Peronosclerospora sorghi TaxID=230839 RepID=A0ACC0VTB5_9STRA|nr:hypothetical protein PsorP6_010211 [Peronosclerospora sorghi]
MRRLDALEAVVPELIALFKFDGNAKSPNLAGIKLFLSEDKRDEDVRSADDGDEDYESDTLALRSNG